MTDINQAADRALNLEKQFRGVLEVGAVLKEIGNLESARGKARQATAQAQELLKHARAEANMAAADLVKAQDEVQVARDEAAQVMQGAETKAEEIVSNAKIQAAAMVAEAQKQVDALKRRTAVAEAAHNDFMDRITAEEQAAQEQVDAVREELDDLLKRIGQG